MDLSVLFKRVGAVVADNSPAILTALGVSGTLTTAYLAAKAGFKSVDVLRNAEEDKREKHFADVSDTDTGEPTENEFEGLTTQEKFEAVWDLYAPAAASAAMTVAAIVLAARVQERRNVALAAAYTTVQNSYTEYRAKNIEKLGKQKEQKLRDEIAQDRVDKTPVASSVLMMTKKGNTLFFDSWTSRYFRSDIESIRKAVNDFNHQVINDSYASLTDLYDLIGIPGTKESDHIGWSTDKLLEIDDPMTTAVVSEDGEPAIVLNFKTFPNGRFASAY